MTGVLGLGDLSRWGGETALEVLGLGCSGELRANLDSFSSSDSILMTFLGHSVWQDFLFCGVAVLETSCAAGSHRVGSGASHWGSGQRPNLGGRNMCPPCPLLLLFSLLSATQITPLYKGCPPRSACTLALLVTTDHRPLLASDCPGRGSCLERSFLTGQPRAGRT